LPVRVSVGRAAQHDLQMTWSARNKFQLPRARESVSQTAWKGAGGFFLYARVIGQQRVPGEISATPRAGERRGN